MVVSWSLGPRVSGHPFRGSSGVRGPDAFCPLLLTPVAELGYGAGMANTPHPHRTTPAATPSTITVRVLYNDAVVNRQSDEEEAFPGKRMSTIDPDLRRSGAVMPAFSRILSGEYYQAGDPLLEVLVEEAPTTGMATAPQKFAHQLCERIYSILQIAHPEGWSHRSMCTGDVIVIGESAWVCDTIGFEPVDISTSEVVSVVAS